MIAWGSYDESKPRVRLLLEELRQRDALLSEINIPVWSSVRDKAVADRATVVKQLLRLLASYPAALLKLIRQPSRSALLLPYPAIPDIFFAWPIARLRGHTIIFDAFISLHDTMVSDRALLPAKGLVAKLLWVLEKLSLSLADIVLVDTDQHGDFFAQEFGVERSHFQTVLVGADPIFWSAREAPRPMLQLPDLPVDRPIILFYGQLIPLHGLDTILRAIELTVNDQCHWLLVGSGQEEQKLKDFLAAHSGNNVSWTPWLEYHDLPALIARSTIALGIFGTSGKAARVIPNKVFQILAVGTPLITRDSPGVAQLSKCYPNAVKTIPAGDGAALAEAVRSALQNSAPSKAVPVAAISEFGPSPGVAMLLDRLGKKSTSAFSPQPR